MANDEEKTKEDLAGGALQKLAVSASDALIDTISSIGGSAVEEAAKRVKDFSISVCRVNLDRMAKENSVVGAEEVDDVVGGVTMSPIIKAMLEACFLSLPRGGNGTTWVVCAPTDQGKTVAAQFLIHGQHSLRPKRSLKIDATNMTNFAKDFAEYLQCSAAQSCMSQLLCEALSDTALKGEDGQVAKATASAMNVSGKYLCVPGKSTALGNLMEMRHANTHKILSIDTKDDEPAPILIVDEFYSDTEENLNFVRTLLRDAAARGIVVFLMTRDPSWASKLIKLNGGTKCKPLPYNIDNPDYDGSRRFTENPLWNELFWSEEELRESVRLICKKYDIAPETAVPDDAKLTPAEATKIVMKLVLKKQLS